MKHGLAIMVAVVTLGAAGCAEMNPFQRDEPTATGSAAGESKQSFGQVDRDGDNNISKSEAEEAGMNELVQNWDQADKDRDNVVDESEFSAFTEGKKGM